MTAKKKTATKTSTAKKHDATRPERPPTKGKPSAVGIENANRILSGGMAQSLGLRYTTLKLEKVVGEMPVLPRHLNYTGRINGGAIMAFADLLGAAGAALHRPPGYKGGTLESKTNFFTSGAGPVMVGTCVPLHIGRTTSVWQTTVTGADGKVFAIVTQTQVALPG